MLHVVHSKIGSTKGLPRLWQEGQRLSAIGFTPGKRFNLRFDAEARTLILELAKSGERLVSSRARGEGTPRPIIDVAGATIERLIAGGDDRVRLVYQPGKIEVSLAPIAQAKLLRETAIRSKINRGDDLDVGSICVGAGVIDHAIATGLHETGIKTKHRLLVDIDGDGLDVALFSNPKTRGASMSIEGSIDEMCWQSLPKLDLLIAGLPCTAASRAGRAKKHLRLPEDDHLAGHLAVSYLATVRASSPAVAVLENVPPYAHTASAAIIRTQLARWGYRTFEQEIRGSEHNAIEDRERWVMVAISEGVAPFHFSVPPTPGQRMKLADILDHVPANDPSWRRHEYLDAHAARHAAAGNNFKRSICDGTEDAIGTLGKAYWKHRSTECHLQSPYDGDKQRLLTPTEHGRAKAIPGDLLRAILSGRSNTRAHELLGQSAIWSVFAAVGRAIGGVLTGTTSQADAASNMDMGAAGGGHHQSQDLDGRSEVRQLALAI